MAIEWLLQKWKQPLSANNNQIDNTSYYRLPCGRGLEDFIWWKKLNFAEGSALKYLYRAGKKDGESMSKDHEKALHYIKYLAVRGCVDVSSVQDEVQAWIDEAYAWDGVERQ